MTKTRVGLNVELLQRVKAHILEEPRRLEMETFAEPSDDSPCGTVACIAGWSAILDKGLRYSVRNNEWLARNNRVVDVEDVAINSLRLNECRGQSNLDDLPWALFCVDYWPLDLRQRYIDSNTDIERAQITAERIDRFIAEYGEI